MATKVKRNNTSAALLRALRLFMIRNNGQTSDYFGLGAHDGISSADLARIVGVPVEEARAEMVKLQDTHWPDGDQWDIVGEGYQTDHWVICSTVLESVLDELGVYLPEVGVPAGTGWSGGVMWRLPDDITDKEIIGAFEAIEVECDAAWDADHYGGLPIPECIAISKTEAPTPVPGVRERLDGVNRYNDGSVCDSLEQEGNGQGGLWPDPKRTSEDGPYRSV